MINIRKETEKDYEKVYDVVKKAFETAEHSDGAEQDLVERLRKSQAFIPELSLVAECKGEIAGHILFTKIRLGGGRAVALAPLAISPDFQKQGIGTLLMEEGHRIAKELGYQVSVVLGSSKYYPRVGYKPASTFGISAPFEVEDEYFMALVLQGDDKRFNSAVEYAKEFFE